MTAHGFKEKAVNDFAGTSAIPDGKVSICIGNRSAGPHSDIT
jgi:hypothetical protein